jgi:hypothetical protein
MSELSLEELVEKIYELKDVESTILARKILQDWHEGVIPSRTSINALMKFLEVDTVCARLGDDGLCLGWLKRHLTEFDFPVNPPYRCPFVGTTETNGKYRSCPGYRKS